MAKRKRVEEWDEVIDLAIESIEHELSLPQKARVYVLLKEIGFWLAVAKEAEERLNSLISLLPDKVKEVINGTQEEE